MKILSVVSAIDLSYGYGCTPAWWQLFKSLYELGHELIVIPYYGEGVETLWWRTCKNPCKTESHLYMNFVNLLRKTYRPFKIKQKEPQQGGLSLSERLAKALVQPKWEKALTRLIEKEKDLDVIIIFNVPLTHLWEIPTKIRKKFNIPIIFYDGDMPDVFPKYAEADRFLYSSYYINADLTGYDAIIVNSEGVIPDLKELGAQKVYVIHYAADPEIYHPIRVEKQDIDVFFYGHGVEYREEWFLQMITSPSKKLSSIKFAVGGREFNIDLGATQNLGPIPFSIWRYYCCRSKVNLNITRRAHATVYASSTSRPFELASLGCCIVSNPINGLDKWFEVDKEIFVARNENEAIELYTWLVESDEKRQRVGEAARQRVLKEHTFHHRAKQLTAIIEKLS